MLSFLTRTVNMPVYLMLLGFLIGSLLYSALCCVFDKIRRKIVKYFAELSQREEYPHEEH